jgi:hypothetical protein
VLESLDSAFRPFLRRWSADTKAATLSIESIFSPSQPAGAGAQCACGAPLAADQRYCLECGERQVPMSSVLKGHPPAETRSQDAAGAPPALPPGAAPPGPSDGQAQRNSTLTVIAGVGVLLLAMGVGVLIGRSGSSRPAPAPAQVISVAPSSGTAGSSAAGEPSFTDDWPAGTKGYTVQLQTLPKSGTTVSAVEQAKAAASAKGAKAVGALKSEDFSSLTAGSYIVYSGVYHKRSEAQKALSSLKRSFPGATVVQVSNGSSASAAEGAAGSSSGGAGSNINHPAPPSVLEGLKSVKGKSYEERSKNLPNVVSTG